jgi:hypothetical protein
MPVIDLKNCIISFEDGHSKTGAVNNTGGYTAGATSMVVDGFTGIVPVGVRLTIGGVSGHTVVSTSQTLGNTTTIVFTPALAANVADNAVVIAGARYVDIRVGDGNVNWSEKKPREYKKDRGLLYQVRDGDEEPMDVNLAMMYEFLTASTGSPATPEDIVKKRGEAAAWISTDPDTCAPYCINIVILHQPAGCTQFEKEKVILPYFRYEDLPHDPKAGSISMTGKCNATQATVTRIAA